MTLALLLLMSTLVRTNPAHCGKMTDIRKVCQTTPPRRGESSNDKGKNNKARLPTSPTQLGTAHFNIKAYLS